MSREGMNPLDRAAAEAKDRQSSPASPTRANKGTQTEGEG